jgi:hypothetical protein
MDNNFLSVLGSDFVTNRESRLEVLRHLVIAIKLIWTMEDADNLFLDDPRLLVRREGITNSLFTAWDQLMAAYSDIQFSIVEEQEFDKIGPDDELPF